MYKQILSAALCCLLALVTLTDATAQQRRFIDGKPFYYRKRGICKPIINGIHPKYRSYDGTNNNVSKLKNEWGSTDIQLYREMPADYDKSDWKNAMNGATRPSARKISNAVCDEPVTNFNERGLSTFNYVWGQFIDHDMSLTPTGSGEYYPVTLPGDETVFTVEIPFNRSEVFTGTGVTNQRQQCNLNTSWIDASMVYGSDSTRAKWLRTFRNGKMKTSPGNLLPFNTVNGEQTGAIDPTAPSMANDADHTVVTFVAGDVRAAEHPGIISLHTLFVREHNRICDRLIKQGYTKDEEIYQMARKEVGAIIQAITYQEFLPAVGVTLNYYKGYNPYSRPDIMNTFATAAYRIGHTMVADDILLRDNLCNTVAPGDFDLIEAFWNPQLVVDYNIDVFLKGFAGHTQYETDTKINPVLRNFLFVSPNDPVRFGIDLASLNIQRGRDHGLPNYNALRLFYTGSKAKTFSQITTNATLAASLQSLYGSVDNIDAWVGLLAEDHMTGKSIGKTMFAMLRTQFENLRDGDYYFYLNDPALSPLTKIQITNTRFADVIKRNTSLTNLQKNVFFVQKCVQDSVEDRIEAQSDVYDNTELLLYPNPVKDVLNITLGNDDNTSNSDEHFTIQMFSVSGALIKTIEGNEKNIQVSVNDLVDGIYFVNVIKSGGMKSLKFVKMSN